MVDSRCSQISLPAACSEDGEWRSSNHAKPFESILGLESALGLRWTMSSWSSFVRFKKDIFLAFWSSLDLERNLRRNASKKSASRSAATEDGLLDPSCWTPFFMICGQPGQSSYFVQSRTQVLNVAEIRKDSQRFGFGCCTAKILQDSWTWRSREFLGQAKQNLLFMRLTSWLSESDLDSTFNTQTSAPGPLSLHYN